MDWRFDRLTTDAQRALVAARWAAMGLRHHAIDTIHLLIGVLDQLDGTVAAELQQRGVEPHALLRRVVQIATKGTATRPAWLPLTPAGERTLDAAHRATAQDGCVRIASVHLLRGCLTTADGTLRDALRPFALVPVDSAGAAAHSDELPATGDPEGRAVLALRACERARWEIEALAGATTAAAAHDVAAALHPLLQAFATAAARLQAVDS